MTPGFAVTWDYRCPFARNAQEHVLTGRPDRTEVEHTSTPR